MEFVYVVPRELLFDLAYPHGFVGRRPPEGHPSLEEYLRRISVHGFFVERAWAERHSSVKQIIPYAVVRHAASVFQCTRLAQAGEARLRGLRSIGIGGHVNPEDDRGDRTALVLRCAERELHEELHLETPCAFEPVGVINDEATPVGSVHFGVVLLARVTSPDVSVREREVLEGGFQPLAEVMAAARDEAARFETWSSLILERMDEVERT
jgi:predicted NUDIX family phosphoesterase